MEYMVIGEIINVRGIKGEVKVKPITSDISRFSKLKVVYIDEKPYKIIEYYAEKNFVYLAMSDITTRNDAEKLKNKLIKIDRINAVDLEPDEFFISDLIGVTVLFSNGEKLGYIDAVDQFGAADVITIKAKNEKKIRVPFLKKIVCCVDIEKREFVVIKERFDEVAVYED